jgi:ATP-dependent metalloprotease
MVTQLGFSDILGNVDLNSNYASLSSETKRTIESEVQRIVDEGRQQAKKVLTERRKELDIIANALVEYEVLTLEEVQKVLKGEKLNRLSAVPVSSTKVPQITLPPALDGTVPGVPGAKTTSSRGNGEDSGPGSARL